LFCFECRIVEPNTIPQIHFRRYHPHSNLKGLYMCPECHTTFNWSDRDQFKDHVRNRHLKYTKSCRYCSRTFNNIIAREEHESTAHQDEAMNFFEYIEEEDNHHETIISDSLNEVDHEILTSEIKIEDSNVS
jgi:hypothetical protein